MALSLLRPSVRVTQTHDGFVLESTHALPEPAPTVLDWLVRWAREQPERTFLAERQAGGWRRLGYRDAQRAVEGLAGELVRRGAGPRGPVMILSDNSVDHGLVTLAAMQVGAPVVPVSPAYSLASTTFGRLRHIASLIEPAVVFAEQPPRHAKAFDALGLADKAMASSDVRTVLDRPAIAAGRADIGPDTIAKVLFTSGSTGEPKGVVNTHRMLTANQESLRACWPFLDEPPVVVDWLPWSHTFGGNHNFNLVLRNGGTLYVDEGRPAPRAIDTTLANMADIGPTLWFNVPRGFDQAAASLERDPALAKKALRNVRVIFYAAAALAASTRARLETIARNAGNPDVFFTSAWGSTETAPLATSAHFETATTGVLGVPVPGVRVKLARVDDKHEIRVKGPNVTPGYWQRGGGVTPAALDADGFLPTGDAGRLVDLERPEAGIAFAGRLSENFKLSSGTWVNVGSVRLAVVNACAPLLADVVIAGHDRDALGALLVVAPGTNPSPEALRDALAAYNRSHPSSSTAIRRALVLDRPLSLDDGETTDKGYTNQRRVLENRASDVQRLFAMPPGPEIIALED